MICKYYYIMKHLPFLSGIHPIMITTIISLLLKVMQLNMKKFSSSSPLQLTTFHKLLKFVCVSVCNCACWAVILHWLAKQNALWATRTPRGRQNVWTTNSFWEVRQIIFITQLNFKSKTQIKNYSFIHKKKCFRYFTYIITTTTHKYLNVSCEMALAQMYLNLITFYNTTQTEQFHFTCLWFSKLGLNTILW